MCGVPVPFICLAMEQFTIAKRVLIVKTFIRTDRLISRNGDNEWSPESCDLTLLILTLG